MSAPADDEMFLLAEDNDWETVAEWCGGHLVNHAQGDSGEFETELVIPREGRKPLSAWLGDYVVRLSDGSFVVYELKEDPDQLTWDEYLQLLR
jgi:hypothetical protein